MMHIEIVNPIKALVLGATQAELDDLHEKLTYTNTAKQQDVKRHYGNHWLRRKDEAAWQAKLDDLKSQVKNTLMFKDEDGIYIRPGSIPYLPHISVKSKIPYISVKKVPWTKPLSFQLHPYQEESWQNLLAAKHANVELCTGSGKSAILLKLCRETGFSTAIIAPSKSIFLELMEKFEYHFGKGMVGSFGNGKKKLGKRFTICISDSICNIEKGTEEWEFFSNLDCIMVDESHTLGAETLEAMCHGVLAPIPYRFFFSGTQTRGDGTEKLLQSIIGETVHSLTTEEAVAGGYICPHKFSIVKIESSNPNYNSNEPLEMKRIHFLRNQNIAAFAAKIANATALAYGQQTLVLVEELSQIAMLIPLLTVPYAYAHSESSAKKLEPLGLVKVDSKEAVEKFNKAESMVLIGTSCIQVGSNIFANHNTVNWVGGASLIKTLQGAVGRSVRLHSHNPWKEKCTPKTMCTIWDFDVYDIPIMGYHLEQRIDFYGKSGEKLISYIKLQK